MTSAAATPMLDRPPLLMLVDGHGLAYRAFHAFRNPLNVRSTGEEVTAVYGLPEYAAALQG